MGAYIQILALVIVGIVLLWFGYTLFLGRLSPLYPYLLWNKKKHPKPSSGSSSFCPICSYKIPKGDQIKTVVFPSNPDSRDCMMHIKGCFSCLENNKPRKCPVCKAVLSLEDFLAARMFQRTFQKNHVHVLGCNKCRKTGTPAKTD